MKHILFLLLLACEQSPRIVDPKNCAELGVVAYKTCEIESGAGCVECVKFSRQVVRQCIKEKAYDLPQPERSS